MLFAARERERGRRVTQTPRSNFSGLQKRQTFPPRLWTREKCVMRKTTFWRAQRAVLKPDGRLWQHGQKLISAPPRRKIFLRCTHTFWVQKQRLRKDGGGEMRILVALVFPGFHQFSGLRSLKIYRDVLRMRPNISSRSNDEVSTAAAAANFCV